MSHFDMHMVRNIPFSTYAKFPEKLTFLTSLTSVSGVRNVSFLENFVYILTG